MPSREVCNTGYDIRCVKVDFSVFITQGKLAKGTSEMEELKKTLEE